MLHGINYIGHTFVLGPYWSVTALGAADASEAAHLADLSPAVESYRAAVAQRRSFVFGDLELMRQFAELARVEAREKTQQAINVATQRRLNSNTILD